MKTQIKSIYGDVLFEYESESIKETVLQAVESGANLSRANLSGANLFGANLFGANLSGANLSEANLCGANLSRANLFGANLSEANLSRANLSRANLFGANLSEANLSEANLSEANLSGADLSRANLSRADLSRANLCGANLCGANLSRANLFGANLSEANLSEANLSEANLSGALNSELVIAKTRILPEGDIIGYKKCENNIIVKLLIPKEAKRNSAFGRKCRAEYAQVLEIIGAEIAISKHDRNFVYKVGDIVRPLQPFDENWMEECASGIHFFITKIEAENY